MPLAHDVAHSESSTPLRVAASLRQRLGAHRMDLWFGPDVRWSISAPSEICIEVSSQFIADCIARMFRNELVQSVEEVFGSNWGYRVNVAENSDAGAINGVESVPPRKIAPPSLYGSVRPNATGLESVHAPAPPPTPSHTSLATQRIAPPIAEPPIRPEAEAFVAALHAAAEAGTGPSIPPDQNNPPVPTQNDASLPAVEPPVATVGSVPAECADSPSEQLPEPQQLETSPIAIDNEIEKPEAIEMPEVLPIAPVVPPPTSLFAQFANAVAAAQAANQSANQPAIVGLAPVAAMPANAPQPVAAPKTTPEISPEASPELPTILPMHGAASALQMHSAASALQKGNAAPRQEAMSAVERLAELRRENERRWDDFIQGEHNRLAYTAATMVLEKPGQITPLFIHGPHGSGKSHLAIGLAHKLRSVYKMRRVLVLTGEQFTIEFTESARGGGFANFRRKYRDVDCLVIDDLQFCLGKAATLAELRNTIDMLLRDRRQVILVADRSLNELSGLTADLHARLAGGMTCGIEPVDLETRVRLLDHLCKQQNVLLPIASIRELAGQSAGDARVLQGLVHRLVAQKRMGSGELTHEQAIRCTLDLLRASQPVVRMNDIERVVCETFGLDDKALRGKTKAQTVSQPRMLAMFLARKYTRSALSEIGDYFGKRQHSTVISAHKKVESWLNEDELIQCGRGRLSVKEILRNLESTLRVG